MRSRNISAQLEGLEPGKPVTKAEADRQRAALDRVLEPMTETVGVHAELITRIALDCERRPEPSAEKRRHPPTLLVYADAGRRVATVTIGERSGSYLIELARIANRAETDVFFAAPAADMHRDWIAVVPAHLPDQAALVIAQHAGVHR
ncbi:hypothetical protein SMD20_00640 [Nonomuraea sp. LP-02]|uniref:hypothetical protein n=1 Tax=Nonomuraea sp. LP-02 TaxID=3097960 RepID=UPI002E30510E|nr:hypothetical protein [Nonomuraea sp. LP-02]MED7922722.1 hypothetical protein [Nonomuraea sp. LP-02]